MKKHTVDLRKKTVKELEKERKNLIIEIEKLRIEWTVNKPKNTNVIGNKHKRLSVLQTVLGEKKELEKIEAKK